MNYKVRRVVFLALLFGCAPQYAQAYLDPASGNALVSFFIAIIGSAVFFLKSLFYKITSLSGSRKNLKNLNVGSQAMPLIFSEGATYWTTFRPIVNEFIAQKVHFQYVTIDIYDPALEIDSEYMHTKYYSKNRFGFAKLAGLSAPVMLSTTPNIGSEGYPLARPKGVSNLVHVFHAMVDVSCYRKGSLDFYNSVLMAGAHEEAFIRLVEKARNLPEKELIVAGLPYLDDLSLQKEQIKDSGQCSSDSIKTVLVAASWGAKGCFTEYGTDFIKTLSKAGFKVIIRLHPHSYSFEAELVEKWKAETSNLENVSFDVNTFATQVMAGADILISDASSIRFDFAFLYEKPVITLPISQQSMRVFEADYMPETWADSMADQIGVVVNPAKISEIDEIVLAALVNVSPEKLRNLRTTFVANFGHSSAVIVNYLISQARHLSLSPQLQYFQEQVDELRGEISSLKNTTDAKAIPKAIVVE